MYIINIWSGITAEVLLLAVGLDVQKILRAGWDKAVISINGTESEGKSMAQEKSTSSGASRSRYSTMARGSPRTIL